MGKERGGRKGEIEREGKISESSEEVRKSEREKKGLKRRRSDLSEHRLQGILFTSLDRRREEEDPRSHVPLFTQRRPSSLPPSNDRFLASLTSHASHKKIWKNSRLTSSVLLFFGGGCSP
jgi:hypothetical protein